MHTLTAFAFAMLISATAAHSLPVTEKLAGIGNPLVDDYLFGAKQIDFEADTKGDFGQITREGVTFISNPQFTIGNFAAGQFNTTGNGHLSNLTNSGSVQSFRFDFSAKSTAFGFNFGGHDIDWLLQGFDSAGNVLEQLLINPLGGVHSGEYFGLYSTIDFKFATLTILNKSASDLVFIDNFTVVSGAQPSPVPVPPALPMIAAALLSLAGVRFSRAKTPAPL